MILLVGAALQFIGLQNIYLGLGLFAVALGWGGWALRDIVGEAQLRLELTRDDRPPRIFLYPGNGMLQLYCQLFFRIHNNGDQARIRGASVRWEHDGLLAGLLRRRNIFEIPVRAVDGTTTGDVNILLPAKDRTEDHFIHFEHTAVDPIEGLPRKSRFVLRLDILGAQSITETIHQFDVKDWSPLELTVREIGPLEAS